MNEAKADSLDVAVELFRPFYWEAILDYEEVLKEEGIEAARECRARWSKADIMGRCQWPYLNDWRSLRDRLERVVGLIMYKPGVLLRGVEGAKLWTFATGPRDREHGILTSVAIQIGQMRRSANVMNRAISPGDERHALDDGSKERLARKLQDRNVKLDNVMKSLQDVKQRLLTQDTLALLAEYSDAGGEG